LSNTYLLLNQTHPDTVLRLNNSIGPSCWRWS